MAKGFQKTSGIDFFYTFSSVIKPSTIHITFTLVVTRNWEIQHIDVNNTFLNGDLHETVYMAQPEGFINSTKPNQTCLIPVGFSKFCFRFITLLRCIAGSSLFLFVYVDDILVTSDDPIVIQHLIHDLNTSPLHLKTLAKSDTSLALKLNELPLLYISSILNMLQIYLLAWANMADFKPRPTPICLSSKMSLRDSQPISH